MNREKYISESLELHLFFDRILKEHAFFLECSFMDKDIEMKDNALYFKKLFSDILGEIVLLSDGCLSSDVLNSNIFFTQYTLSAEDKTSQLLGIPIDSEITNQELNLKSGSLKYSGEMIDKITQLNRRTILLIHNYIYFQRDILNRVLVKDMYINCYDSIVSHFMKEEEFYYQCLLKLVQVNLDNKIDDKDDLIWNQFMMEHANFIRGMLDPSEDRCIHDVDAYSKWYMEFSKKIDTNADDFMKMCFQETIRFRDFQVSGEEGIMNSQIKSVITPLYADHVVRETNYFIRKLEKYNV